MVQGRQSHTATLLNDGRVLIVGGVCGTVDIRCSVTAELYDPATGTFARTGQMASNRTNHAAILLPDGRVLVAGGTPYGSAPPPEIYDPATGVFTSVDLPGVEAPAILLNDGRVLLSGRKSFVLYEPSSGETSTVPLPFDIRTDDGNTRLTRLANGDILVTGYFEAFRFNVRDRHISIVPSLVIRGTTANVLPDGRVFVAGGYRSSYGDPTNRIDFYEPAEDRVSLSASLNVYRAAHTATAMPDGTVLLTGGLGLLYIYDDYQIFSQAELFDVASKRTLSVASMSVPRIFHSATLLGDGRVLIAGGVSPRSTYDLLVGPPMAQAELYVPPNRIPAASLYAQPDGSGAILHGGTSRLVTPEDPAEPGEVLELYGTGLGDGGVIPPLVFIGGRAAEVLYFGKAPGYDQINVRVPSGIAPGSAISVRMNYMDRPSNQVTLAIR
jgi:hypothetical protein